MARLRYVSTEAPGFTRKKQGRGFTYLDEQGKTICDPEVRAWIKSLVIPPAWTEVWISPHQNGHILATGRDDKGRKQYIYHPEWQQTRNQKKFDQLVEFGQHLPQIRTVTDEHLRRHKLSRERVLAAIIQLLERTLIRIGNGEYAQKNDSYGLTTLEDDHAEINGSKIVFDFVGKSGKPHKVVLRDRRLARVVKQCQDIPGYELFQYYEEDGTHRVVDSSDVNGYLHDITGKPFTAKVFRTWGGSILAVKYLAEHCRDIDSKQAGRECVAHVAELLGNTKTISRDYYIHPVVWQAHLDGTLQAIYDREVGQAASDCDLAPEERTLMQLIEQLDSHK